MRKRQQDSMRVFLAVVLIVVGGLSLMGAGLLWPLFVLMPGLAFIAVAVFGSRETGWAYIPGMLIGGTGALLFVQNLTGYWESWSYAWTLYGVFLGIAFVLMARQMGLQDDLEAVGHGFIRYSLITFLVFSFLMEIVFKVGGGFGLWPMTLILIGAYLVWQTMTGGRRPAMPKRKNDLKLKRGEKLFTGPLVYGSRYGESRLSAPEPDEHPSRRHDA